MEDLHLTARPQKGGRAPLSARGIGPLSPAARGRIAGPAVGVAAVTPRHRPGTAFAHAVAVPAGNHSAGARISNGDGGNMDTELLTPADGPAGRGLHSFTLELNLSTSGTHSWVKLGYVGHKDSSRLAESERV